MEANFSTPAQDYYEVVKRQTQLLEDHDLYTVCYPLRVARTSYFIVHHLGLSSNQRRRVYLAASAHDIDEIGVPDMILQENEGLTTRKWAIMKQRPALGVGMLTQSASTKEIAYIMWRHHEHYDGTGYPSALCGDRTPLEARVITVRDSFDAIKSKRAYRDSLSDQACQNEIEKNIGAMYDPMVTELVLRNWQTMQKLRNAK